MALRITTGQPPQNNYIFTPVRKIAAKTDKNNKRIQTLTHMKDLLDFIGSTAYYDAESGRIYGRHNDGREQIIADTRGWSAIQDKFTNRQGQCDEQAAAAFQDQLGEFIAEAINLKLKVTV